MSKRSRRYCSSSIESFSLTIHAEFNPTEDRHPLETKYRKNLVGIGGVLAVSCQQIKS